MTSPGGPLAHFSVPLCDVGVAHFAGLGLDPGAPIGTMRVVLQARPAGGRHFSSVKLDAETGRLRVGSDGPVARMRAAAVPGTFGLKLFMGEQAVQVAPTRELGIGMGPSGSVNVQSVRGVLHLASPFFMSARVDWDNTGHLLATPGVVTDDEFRLVPDFPLAYSAGGRSPWDWWVSAGAAELLEFGLHDLDAGALRVTAPARPAQQLRAWLGWVAAAAIFFVLVAAALGAGWGLSAAARRSARTRTRASSPTLLADAVSVRRTADGGAL